MAEFSETNSLDAWIPEIWANEAVAILLENMVIGQLVNRDFEDEIAAFGDVVNTRKPGTFTAVRKIGTDDVTVQNATATNIPVKLDQHFHTSFVIRDQDNTLSFKDLVTEYLNPAVISLAQAADKVLLGQHVRFMTTGDYNVAGQLGGLTSSNAKDFILDTRQVMNAKKVPAKGRVMILNPSTETQILKDDDFTAAERVGDEGTALREASLGRKLGFDIFMCQNMSSFTTGNVVTAGKVLKTSAAAGATSLVVANTGTTDFFKVGDVIYVTGDGTPQIVTAVALVTGSTDEETLTVSPGLKTAVTAGATAIIYGSRKGMINGAKDAGYSKTIVINDDASAHTAGLVVGQQIAISGSASAISSLNYYTIISAAYDSGATTVTLDRPLADAILDNAIVCIFPTGNYNFAFNTNAITFVNRPLAPTRPGMGALSAIASYDGVSVRVTMSYNGKGQGTLVTVDMLCGVAVLDEDLGAVMLG